MAIAAGRVGEPRPRALFARHDLDCRPAQRPHFLAPLIVGLLTDIRRSLDGAACDGHQAAWPPLLLLLEERATVASLWDVPAMLSEAGGKGRQVMWLF